MEEQPKMQRGSYANPHIPRESVVLTSKMANPLPPLPSYIPPKMKVRKIIKY